MLFPVVSMADTCPSVAEIIERNISKKYEWTVEENTSLDDVLSVNRLYAVRILEQGDYVSCFYATRKWPLKLDAKPETRNCTVEKTGGDWQETETGNLVCLEKNLFDCTFRISCNPEE